MICASLMHSLVLNLIRSELEQYVLKDTGSDVVDEGGLLDRRELAEALGKVDWYSDAMAVFYVYLLQTNNW